MPRMTKTARELHNLQLACVRLMHFENKLELNKGNLKDETTWCAILSDVASFIPEEVWVKAEKSRYRRRRVQHDVEGFVPK